MKGSDEASQKSSALTCAAFAGGSLRTSARAQVPVDRCLRRGQHPIVAEGGGGCCQGLATQSCTWLVHGVGVGHRHGHVHGEVLLGQRCRLQDTDTGIYTQHSGEGRRVLQQQQRRVKTGAFVQIKHCIQKSMTQAIWNRANFIYITVHCHSVGETGCHIWNKRKDVFLRSAAMHTQTKGTTKIPQTCIQVISRALQQSAQQIHFLSWRRNTLQSVSQRSSDGVCGHSRRESWLTRIHLQCADCAKAWVRMAGGGDKRSVAALPSEPVGCYH